MPSTGKTMCGSNKVTGAKGIHIVSAWSDELSLILGQAKTDEKSNEITAIPELLKLIDIRGMIITIDAMGCQKKICEKIKKKKANNVNIDKKQVLFFLTFLLKNYYRGFYDICRKNS